MSTKYATITTSRGVITAELFARDCPATVENFESLAHAGFYDGMRFHDVDGGRVAHTGDPLSKTLLPGDPQLGTGGPGYTIQCEIVGNRRTHVQGALSMDHVGPDTGGSRFFFVVGDRVGETFDGRHTVFGQVEDGLDILQQIEPNDLITEIRVWE
jgi:peptidyl-prolyl cis-trans isomerase B (cyclophilin B)